MCSHMLAGASAASSMIGSVVEDVETVVDASSFDALALEASIVLTCPFCSKKCMSCGRGGGSQYTLYMGVMHVMDSNNSVHDVSSVF